MPVRRFVGHNLLLPLLGVLLAALVLTGSPARPGTAVRGSSERAAVASPAVRLAGSTTKVWRALNIARNQKGDPYRYGAAGPNAFDCSGLVYFSTHRAGFTGVPRTSSAQGRFMHHIKRSSMHPGDFMFFTGSSGVYHVGIFVGWINGRRAVLHAPHSGTRVRVDRNWTDHWFPGSLR